MSNEALDPFGEIAWDSSALMRGLVRSKDSSRAAWLMGGRLILSFGFKDDVPGLGGGLGFSDTIPLAGLTGSAGLAPRDGAAEREPVCGAMGFEFALYSESR